jgi:hypothetical protein
MIWCEFLNGIAAKYNDYFVGDKKHLKIFENAYTIFDDFIHVIDASMCFVSKLPCACCTFKDTVYTLIKINIFGGCLSLYYSCYYGCPINITDEVFKSIKNTVYSVNGMHLFDLQDVTLNFFKHENKKIEQCSRVYFLGNIYNNENPSTWKYHLEFIRNDTKWNFIAMYGLVGNIIEPLHFYGIFIDKTSKTIYVYNSMLGNYPTKFLDHLNEYHVKVNTAQHQFKNELCGFFSLRFLRLMSYDENNSKNQIFEKYFKGNSENLDNEIQINDQRKYIFPCTDKYKHVEQFFRIWAYL